MSHSKSAARIFGILALSGLAGACGQPGDTVESARDSQETTGQIVASVELSPTHKVEFIDYGDVARVSEVYDADKDHDEVMTLKNMAVGDRPFAEIYDLMTTGRPDHAVAQKLRDLDARLARLNGLSATSALPAAGARGAARAAATPVPPASDDIELRQGQLFPSSCPEPRWNWAAEANWYFENFCTGGPALCSPNQAQKLAWGWDGPLRRFELVVMNQSHCAAQGWWQMKWRNNTGTHQPTNTVIAPRNIRHEVWSGGTNVQYFNSMEPREAGKFVAMTIYRTRQ